MRAESLALSSGGGGPSAAACAFVSPESLFTKNMGCTVTAGADHVEPGQPDHKTQKMGMRSGEPWES